MKPKNKTNKTGILLLAAALSLGSAVSAFAADGGAAPPSSGPGAVLSMGTSPALGQVPIGGGSYFEVRNVSMLPDSGSKTVTFTLTVTNGGSSELLFIDYWVRLKTKSGNDLSVRVLPQDKDKNRISPKSSQDISFYATVNEATELNDLIFQLIKWDFSQPNFERALGEIPVPDDYNIVAKAGESQTIQMAGNPVKTTVKKVLLGKNEKNYTPTVVLTVQNTGSRSSAVPSYQYLLRTAGGDMYPLEAKGIKDLVINPKTDKDIELSGSVPVSVFTEGWQLVIVQNAADLKLNLPIAFYELPSVTDPDNVDSGKEYTFTNEKGTYTTQLNAVQRLPWEDQDILTARLTLSDKGPESLPIPDFAGYFMLDDNVKVEAKLIRTDNVIGLAPGASTQIQFIGKIPYTYEFGKVKLVLQEKKGSDGGSSGSGTAAQTTILLEFVHRSEMMNMTYNNVGETFKSTGVGRSASYSVRGVTTYSGDTEDMFAVQMEVTNLEKRFSDVTKLVAQFKTSDGTVYPAAVSEIKNKISPNGKVILMLSSPVPRSFPTSGMHVMIGEAVTEDKLTAGDKKPDAYVNAAAFWLPQESYSVKPDLMDLDLTPYKLSINHINTWLDQQGVGLKFNYELSKDLLMQTNTDGRKLVIGLEDEKGQIKFTREFDFKDFEGATPQNPGTGSGTPSGTTDDKDKIKLGKVENFEIKVNDRNLIFFVETLKNYKLNIYDSFQGHKKLLASKKIQWFEPTD
ncbi:hypothetical protein O9H85_02325 [Paenibacillus filicis]|uniref:Uncharacterized protein n=1 Tax=Paenibacillus gyeongsangnamensis TaxID=3388067 RepID=A0ABT4Q344_9BACL|nr:hypothetical protein [Paenibacillus filicis]MCZ8511293.1 hypothetical protein [Paenibacillus filicis]